MRGLFLSFLPPVNRLEPNIGPRRLSSRRRSPNCSDPRAKIDAFRLELRRIPSIERRIALAKTFLRRSTRDTAGTNAPSPENDASKRIFVRFRRETLPSPHFFGGFQRNFRRQTEEKCVADRLERFVAGFRDVFATNSADLPSLR